MTSPTPRTILVVEDEPDLRELVTGYLSSKGYTTVGAEGGTAALAVLAQQPVDLIISDIRMPKGDGISLLEAVRKKDPQYPRVILISGFSDYTPAECKEKGAFGTLAKPFDLDEFTNLIQDALQETSS